MLRIESGQRGIHDDWHAGSGDPGNSGDEGEREIAPPRPRGPCRGGLSLDQPKSQTRRSGEVTIFFTKALCASRR